LLAIDPRQTDADSAAVKVAFSKAPEIEVREGDRITKDVKVTAVETADAAP
jgi:hypothetical protein